MMNLVGGATALLATDLCRRLRQFGLSVRRLECAGSPKEAALFGLGLETVMAT
jgi:hypothetical protein